MSSPAPEFESISSSVLSLLYGLTLMFVHDYWKNHRIRTHQIGTTPSPGGHAAAPMPFKGV